MNIYNYAYKVQASFGTHIFPTLHNTVKYKWGQTIFRYTFRVHSALHEYHQQRKNATNVHIV